jgi:hypothetical protein
LEVVFLIEGGLLLVLQGLVVIRVGGK